MYTYCVFGDTQRCGIIAKQAEALLHCKAIRPRRERLLWVKREPVREVHDLLPGYIFLYTEEEIPDISMLRGIPGVIRCLSDTEHRYVLQGEDEAFALMLLRRGGVIGRIPVYQEGQMIRIAGGVFGGVQAKILRVDRRQARMEVALPFDRTTVKTWLEFELVEELPDRPDAPGESPADDPAR